MEFNITDKKNDILKRKFKHHTIKIINKNAKIILSLTLITLVYFIFSDLYLRHSLQSFYARLLPLSLGITTLLLHLISSKNKFITVIFFNLFLASVPIMMYALLFIFKGTDTFNETITATILTIFLISLIIQTNNISTVIIYFLPFTLFILLLLLLFDVSKKELLEIVNIIPMLFLGFAGNRIQYKLKFKNFEANFYLNIEKKKTDQLYKETLLQNEQLQQHNEEIISQKDEIETQAKELQSYTEELRDTNDKLKELNNFKLGVIGMIIHDLKNPLNSIINLAKRDVIKQSGKQMLNMVMNILDVYKYEDAEIQLQTNNNSIYEVSKSAGQQVNFLCESKNIRLKNNIKNYVVKIDTEIIKRVFVNILTNAIKHTPNNKTITLESSLVNTPFKGVKGNANFIRIKISDPGQGIPADKLDNIFGKFEQVSEKKSEAVHSTGIGLTFCKLFTKAHGGEIGVESEQGKETTFWFTLPLGEQADEDVTVKEKISEKKTFELTQTDKEILKPYLSKLQKLEVFEFSDIKKIIKQIDFSKTPNLQKWQAELENTLYVMNEEKYKELIKKIN